MAITTKELKNILTDGESVKVEFKRCDGGICHDTYETVCSFSNRYGGDIFLGVDNSGKVCGVPEKAMQDIIRNFVTTVNNPEVFSPIISLDFSPKVLKYAGKSVIHIRVPPSPDIHRYKKEIYDRVNDSDIKITATKQIRAMCIRKQKYSTESMIYPHIRESDLRLDMLPIIRQMAVNHRQMAASRIETHPWEKLTDKELLKSAKLYTEDIETQKWGYNLAAVMLLGKDDLISNIVPSYRTDALLRKVNIDRYDDREMITTNLIDSYGLLMKFARKHLLDKFYLENDIRVSLLAIIAREMLVNTLMHREFTSSISARFIIEKDKMFTENANRADTSGKITPENFTSNSKNPIIAAFFRNIGMADELGSGVRNLYYYAMRYSGKLPEMIEGDVFRTIIPLDDEYSYDVEIIKTIEKAQNKRRISAELAQNKRNVSATKTQPLGHISAILAQNRRNISAELAQLKRFEQILEYLAVNPYATQIQTAKAIGKSRRTVQNAIIALKNKGLLERIGKTKGGLWVVKLPQNRVMLP
jgi:ATP-dependent DNA helicase RecG